MDDRDVLTMEHYLVENFREPIKDEHYSYCQWAANEILDRIIDETYWLPRHISGVTPRTAEEVIEDFISQVERMRFEATNDRTRTIFEVAAFEASMVLDYFHASR